MREREKEGEGRRERYALQLCVCLHLLHKSVSVCVWCEFVCSAHTHTPSSWQLSCARRAHQSVCKIYKNISLNFYVAKKAKHRRRRRPSLKQRSARLQAAINGTWSLDQNQCQCLGQQVRHRASVWIQVSPPRVRSNPNSGVGCLKSSRCAPEPQDGRPVRWQLWTDPAALRQHRRRRQQGAHLRQADRLGPAGH